LSEEVNTHIVGFSVIKEMTREQLIEEIIFCQRAELATKESTELKSIVANFRIEESRLRIIADAGLVVTASFLGGTVVDEE
jgi:hypothetical protein